jgi:hypothetical protein
MARGRKPLPLEIKIERLEKQLAELKKLQLAPVVVEEPKVV